MFKDVALSDPPFPSSADTSRKKEFQIARDLIFVSLGPGQSNTLDLEKLQHSDYTKQMIACLTVLSCLCGSFLGIWLSLWISELELERT